MRCAPLRATVGKQRGLSLVELMVALVLGLMLLAAVSQVYLLNKVSFTTQQQQGLMQEGGRFVLELLARDARMAGLAGCSSRRPPEFPLPVRNYLASTAFPFDLAAGIRGYEADGSAPGDTLTVASANPSASGDGADWTPALPAGLAAGAIAGSDVLVVSSMGRGIPLVSPFTSGAQVFVADASGIQRGDILLVSDCQQAQVFQATTVAAAGGNIAGAAGGGFAPGNSTPIAERGPSGPFQAGSELARLQTHAWFVGPGADGGPSLFRAALAASGTSAALSPEELVRGVESMQVLYALDDNFDFVADRYVGAGAVGDWQRVVGLQVALLVRAAEEYGTTVDVDVQDLLGTSVDPVDDRRQRRVFASTIALRNRLL